MSFTDTPVTAVTPPRPAPNGPLSATVRVTVVGEVDLATAAKLRYTLLSVLYDHQPTVLHVDLAQVSFLDCTGIGALVSARNAADAVGCRLWISDPQPIVRRVMQASGLLTLFTDPDSAVSSTALPVAA